MKKFIIAFVSLLFIPGIGLAQQTENKDKKEKEDTVISWHAYIRRPQVVAIKKMDQRKVYRWRNGQKSTASGRQAGDPSAKFARVYGDSAMVVKKPISKK